MRISQLFTKPFIATIDDTKSHVPLMATEKSDDHSFLTQSLKAFSAEPELHNFLQSFPMTAGRDGKRSRTICQPKGTVPYTVNDSDTFEKVALRFNATPSELLQLNKLSTRMIFPGQVLFVPEECPSDNVDQPQPPTNTNSSLSPPLPTSTLSPTSPVVKRDGDAFVLIADRRLSGDLTSAPLASLNPPPQSDVGPMVWSMARQPAARPGRVQRLKSESAIENEPKSAATEDQSKLQSDDQNKPVSSPHKSVSSDDGQQADDECLQRFIKINVRLMTEDRQSVAGTLLVTPNAIMFDPDVLDPLVKEHGIMKYGLIIRMDLLGGIALYDDLSVYEQDATLRDEEKRKMWYSSSIKNAEQGLKNPIDRSDEEQIHDLMISLLDQIDRELNPSDSIETSCKLFDAKTSNIHRLLSKASSDNVYDDDDFLTSARHDSLSDDSFQPFDDYKHSLGILLDENEKLVHKTLHRVPSQVSYVFDWSRFRRAVKIKKGCHLENCVSLDEFNKRFDEIDKLLYKQQQHYGAPRSIEIPYYLCIKTSVHIHDVPSLRAKQHKTQQDNAADNFYGKKRLEQEYWFSVPKEKIDQLYNFFLRLKPEHDPDPLIDHPPRSPEADQLTTKGFVLLANDDRESSDEHHPSTSPPRSNQQKKKTHYLKRQNTLLKEWEIISVDEIYRRFNASHDHDSYAFDRSIPPPKLLQPSTLINEEQSKQLLLELPARVHGMSWNMVFSTETHGFSLTQLYRHSLEFDRDMPVLLIVKDVEQNVFGAFVPHQLIVKDGVYGTGESFLFTLLPELRVFNWSGDNDLFVKGDLNSIGFGIGEGKYGLWLDGHLHRGRTCSCKTFNNEPLSSNEDFIIASLEVWTFTD